MKRLNFIEKMVSMFFESLFGLFPYCLADKKKMATLKEGQPSESDYAVTSYFTRTFATLSAVRTR